MEIMREWIGKRRKEGNETRRMNRFGESINNEIDTNEMNEIKTKKNWKWNIQGKNTIKLNKQIRRVYEKWEQINNLCQPVKYMFSIFHFYSRYFRHDLKIFPVLKNALLICKLICFLKKTLHNRIEYNNINIFQIKSFRI